MQKRDLYLNQVSNKKGAIGKPDRPKKHPIWAAHRRIHLSTKYPPGIIHNTKAAVVGISESWLDHSTDEEIHNDGFCTLRNDGNREGGGVCTFKRNDIAFRNRDDLNHESLEATWFELLMPKSKPIMIGSRTVLLRI